MIGGWLESQPLFHSIASEYRLRNSAHKSFVRHACDKKGRVRVSAAIIKASYALGYIRDTENVRIRRCRISSYLEGTLLDGTRISAEGQTSPFYGAPGTDMHGGRIKIGTESSGSFRHIRVRNCVLADCGGLILNSMDGGVIEDAVFSNIKMNRVFDCPIFLRLGDRMRSPEGMPVGSIRFSFLKEDTRPDFYVEDAEEVKGIRF